MSSAFLGAKTKIKTKRVTSPVARTSLITRKSPRTSLMITRKSPRTSLMITRKSPKTSLTIRKSPRISLITRTKMERRRKRRKRKTVPHHLPAVIRLSISTYLIIKYLVLFLLKKNFTRCSILILVESIENPMKCS